MRGGGWGGEPEAPASARDAQRDRVSRRLCLVCHTMGWLLLFSERMVYRLYFSSSRWLLCSKLCDCVCMCAGGLSHPGVFVSSSLSSRRFEMYYNGQEPFLCLALLYFWGP